MRNPAKLLIVAAWVLGLALPSAAEKTEIRIGALLHLTGEYAMQGAAFHEGILLAVDQVNAGGGIAGRPIKLIVEDTHYNMSQAHTAATKLLRLDHVIGAIVTNYTEVMTVGPVFERAKVPLVTLWDSAPEIEALGEYVFGIGTWTPSTSDSAVAFARGELKASKAITVASNGQWSLSAAGDFTRKFREAGGAVLGTFEQNPADSDYRPILTRIRALAPDVIYAPVSDQIPAFFQQIHDAGIRVPIITSDVVTAETISATRGGAEGVYQTQTADPAGPITAQMLAAYQTKFDRPCTQTLFTAWGYDAVLLLAEGLRRGAATPQELNQALYKIHDLEGASSRISINPEGSSRVPVVMHQVRDGRLAPLD